MKRNIFLSSEIYHLDPNDINVLKDSSFHAKTSLPDGQIIILLGNQKKKIEDSILQGRAIILQAIENKTDYIPVRIAFYRNSAWGDFFSLFLKNFRKYFYSYGSHVYHIDPIEIRKKKLESTIQDLENIEIFLENSSLKRKQQFYALKDSLQKNGFNDLFPMEIVLCCIWGVQDTLYQGHYRMALCLNMGIKRVSVRFLSAPHAPRWMSFFLIKWRQSIKKKK